MPFADHVRCSWRGVFGTKAAPLEEWSIRLNCDGGAGINLATSEALRDAWTPTVGGFMRSYARLTEVKCARIGSDGKYTGDPYIVETDLAGAGAGTQVHPFQVALVASLGTGQRGARKRGRIFLPAPAVSLATDGTMSTADQTAAQASVKAFLNAVRGIPEIGEVVVASSFGFNTPVTEIRVGRVLDTMRTRRRSQPEGYTAPVPL